MTIPLVICGAQGRMGRTLTKMIQKDSRFDLVGGTVRKLEPKGSTPFLLYEDLEQLLLVLRGKHLSPLIIDFSHQELFLRHLSLAKTFGSGFLLATTGHAHIEPALFEAASSIPVVYAPNTSLMASLMLELTKVLSRCLSESDISIIDLHHALKRDAPSGTAKALLEAIHKARPQKPLPLIHSLRHGTVAGEHTVCFFNQFERLEIVHRVEDRQVFAQGALVAAQFLSTAAPGLYDMRDVLKVNWL